MGPRIAFFVGLNWVSARKSVADGSCGMMEGLRCDYLKRFGGKFESFSNQKERSTDSPPAQRHIMYVILTFLFYI